MKNCLFAKNTFLFLRIHDLEMVLWNWYGRARCARLKIFLTLHGCDILENSPYPQMKNGKLSVHLILSVSGKSPKSGAPFQIRIFFFSLSIPIPLKTMKSVRLNLILIERIEFYGKVT